MKQSSDAKQASRRSDLGKLALNASIEIGRELAGHSRDPSSVQDLIAELRQTPGFQANGTAAALIPNPGLVNVYSRALEATFKKPLESFDDVKKKILEISDEALSNDEQARRPALIALRDFCRQLHRELVARDLRSVYAARSGRDFGFSVG